MDPDSVSSVNIDENEPFLKNGSQLILRVGTRGRTLHVFVNGNFAGKLYGSYYFYIICRAFALFSKGIKTDYKHNVLQELRLEIIKTLGLHLKTRLH